MLLHPTFSRQRPAVRTTAAGESKRVYDPIGTRGRILDVAAAAFQSRGYHATSMHDIMHDADATGGALYHHFSSKKALGLAVIRERVARDVEVTCIEPVRSARTAADGIFSVFERVVAELDGRKTILGCPLNNLALELSLADPEFRTAIEDLFERWRTAIVQRVRGDQTAGLLNNVDAVAFATFVVASFSGAMAQAKAAQNPAPLKACAQQLSRLMWSRGERPRSRRQSRRRVNDPSLARIIHAI
jgi:AcrR family transcriptional regulator